MAVTYEPITTTTLGTSAATITFSSIAASWTDLRLVIVGTPVTAGGVIYGIFNGLTTGIYSWIHLIGTGTTVTTAVSNPASAIFYNGIAPTAITTTANTIDILGYANTTLYKTILNTRAGDTNGGSGMENCLSAGSFKSTAAITSITLTNSAVFAVGTTATLFGIKAA